jgi:hypothetical protein
VLGKVALSFSLSLSLSPSPALCLSVCTPILRKYRILGYYRFVDYISVIYNGKATNIDNMLSEFNILLPKIKFISVLKENSKISCLDMTVTKLQTASKQKTDNYRPYNPSLFFPPYPT